MISIFEVKLWLLIFNSVTKQWKGVEMVCWWSDRVMQWRTSFNGYGPVIVYFHMSTFFFYWFLVKGRQGIDVIVRPRQKSLNQLASWWAASKIYLSFFSFLFSFYWYSTIALICRGCVGRFLAIKCYYVTMQLFYPQVL